MNISSKDDAWFAEWTAQWDAMQDAYVPRRREAFALMADILVEQFPDRCRVIDVGAGAGTLAETILSRHPNASLLCLDVERFLLEAAGRRLRPFGARAKIARCDLRKEGSLAELAEPAEEPGGPRATRPTSPQRSTSAPNARGEDVGRVALGPPQLAEGDKAEAVVMTTTAHWFGQERVEAIYRCAADVLADDGLFMVFDHIPPDDEALARLALEMNEAEVTCRFQQGGAQTWEEFWQTLGGSLGAPDYAAEIAAPAWGAQDGPEAGHAVAVHRRLLLAAGFRHVAAMWRHLSDALLVARR